MTLDTLADALAGLGAFAFLTLTVGSLVLSEPADPEADTYTACVEANPGIDEDECPLPQPHEVTP